MKKYLAIIAAVFLAVLSFAVPITAFAIDSGYTFTETPAEGDTYFWFCLTTGGATKSFYYHYPSSWNVQVDVSTSDGWTTYDINGNIAPDINYYNFWYGGSRYSGRNTYIGKLVVNHSTGEIHAFQGNDVTEINLLEDGRNFSSWDNSTNGVFYAYDFLTDEFTWHSNIPEPNPLDLSVSFTPTLSGDVSRSTVVNGITYTSDTFNMSVTNNGQNAQFAMFIVPSGDSITIPALQWSTSDIYSGNPVFVYVKDEWIYDSLTFDAQNTGSAFKPSCLHYVPSNLTYSYDIAWSSLRLSPNTSYDVVVYGAVSDSPDYVSLNTSLEYEEVYRSTFSMSSVATFNPDNDITDNYSWDNTKDNKELFNISKATRDNWGNFAVSNNGGQWYGTSSLKTSSVTSLFRSVFGFMSSVFGFLPPAVSTIFTIGLSALVVVGVVKVAFK